MSRYLMGQEIVLLWYTQDLDGNDQNCDTTPTVTVYGAGSGTATVTNPSTGVYTSTYLTTDSGRHVFEFAGLLDTDPQLSYQWCVVHDGEAEAGGGPFPHGNQSWESAVR